MGLLRCYIDDIGLKLALQLARILQLAPHFPQFLLSVVRERNKRINWLLKLVNHHQRQDFLRLNLLMQVVDLRLGIGSIDHGRAGCFAIQE